MEFTGPYFCFMGAGNGTIYQNVNMTNTRKRSHDQMDPQEELSMPSGNKTIRMDGNGMFIQNGAKTVRMDANGMTIQNGNKVTRMNGNGMFTVNGTNLVQMNGSGMMPREVFCLMDLRCSHFSVAVFSEAICNFVVAFKGFRKPYLGSGWHILLHHIEVFQSAWYGG
uniref:Uncharacterized protein n=1 Tax=Biomphalaria glabrata TaxID=6526 RepID=A0A2C9M9R8_BIOGL